MRSARFKNDLVTPLLFGFVKPLVSEGDETVERAILNGNDAGDPATDRKDLTSGGLEMDDGKFFNLSSNVFGDVDSSPGVRV